MPQACRVRDLSARRSGLCDVPEGFRGCGGGSAGRRHSVSAGAATADRRLGFDTRTEAHLATFVALCSRCQTPLSVVLCLQALLRRAVVAALPQGSAQLNTASARIRGLEADLCRSLRAEIDGKMAQRVVPPAECGVTSGGGGTAAAAAAEGERGRLEEATDAAAEAMLGALGSSAAAVAAGLKQRG